MFVKKQMIWKVGVAALCAFGMLVQSAIPIGSLRGAAYALEDDPTPIIYAQSLLTEVYSYPPDTIDNFVYKVTDDGEIWTIVFYPEQHPDWQYRGIFRKEAGEGSLFVASYTPFTGAADTGIDEGSVRHILQAIEADGWFWNFDGAAKAALAQTIVDWEIPLSGSALDAGLQSANYTPTQALTDFFILCYGPALGWSAPLTEWCDTVFALYELTREQKAMTTSDIIALCQADLMQTWPENTPFQVQVSRYESNTNGLALCKWLIIFYEDAGSSSRWTSYQFADPPGKIISTMGDTSEFAADPSMLHQVAMLTWEEERGLYSFWSVEDKALFDAQIDSPMGLSSGIRTPRADEITAQQAIAAADGYLTNTLGISQAAMNDDWQSVCLYDVEDAPFWLVRYLVYDPSVSIGLFYADYSISIDTQTGEVLQCFARDGGQ